MSAIPETMKGVCLTGFGGFDKLEYREDIKVPTPKKGEVLIKIGAAAVNNTDINTRIGWYSKNVKSQTNDGGEKGFKDVDEDGSWLGKTLVFPRRQGADACGTIVAVGEGVSRDRIGERVLVQSVQPSYAGDNAFDCITWGSECDGGFAEYATALDSETFAVTSGLTDGELATFPCSYGTANNLIWRTGINKGDVCLITGASGGVGSALVQLAKIKGAKVIGVCDPGQEDRARGYGADDIILRGENYEEKLGAMSVDVVLDVVAGSQWPQLMKIMKKGGRYGVCGAIGGPLVEFDIRDCYLKDLTLCGTTFQSKESFKELIDYIEKGLIQPVVAEEFPLKDIVKAQEAFLSKKLVGKFVLNIAED